MSSILAGISAERLVTAEDADVRRLADLVAAVSDVQLFRARCLQQCLALCWMLRRRGVAAEFVMGVHKFPFRAHVWLECGEEIIQWEAGLGETANRNVLRSMRVIFRAGKRSG